MAIELSNITFTDQDDIVPPSGVEEIVNTGIANTLAGNDKITGRSEGTSEGLTYSFRNYGTLNTGEGNDILTGTLNDPYGFALSAVAIYNEGAIDTGDGNDIITAIIEEAVIPTSYAIYNIQGTIDTGDGNDIITGITPQGMGILSWDSNINTGDGDDTITGTALKNFGYFGTYGIRILGAGSFDTEKGNDIIAGTGSYIGIFNGLLDSSFNTGEGNDTITGNCSTQGFGIVNYRFMDTGSGNDIIAGNHIDETDGFLDTFGTGILNGSGMDPGFMDTGDGNDTITGFSNAENGDGLRNYGTINTGNCNDIITGTGSAIGITNDGTINTGNSEDSIISQGKLINRGGVFLGEGNDSITANTDFPNRALENYNAIDTGDGDDTITSTGIIYNQGIINTGNGNDSIIVDGTGTGYGIYNNGGAIITGNGNDSIIANEGFESAPNSSGSLFLGEGEDYIKGFGSGDFYGGNGNDTLELTPGTYTVGIWDRVTLTKGNSLMLASEFEQLIAGGTTYLVASLIEGQTIFVD